jgi:NADPH2:quinone reductase
VVFGGGSDCESKENMEFLNELLVKGELRPTLDRTFPFQEIVEAHRYTEAGKKRGNVAIEIEEDS